MSEFVWIGEGWEGWKEVVLTEITLGDQWILPKIFTSRARRKWEKLPLVRVALSVNGNYS